MVRKVDGSIEEFDDSVVGVPLGVMEDMEYTLQERSILPGESVVVYTDGVSEAMNPQSELYSIERLKQTVSSAPAEVVQLGQTIRADVKKHANGRPQNDDITLMVFGRTQGEAATTDVMAART
jgi:serine phosphatase RsbU (regulator of sigma subunit)